MRAFLLAFLLPATAFAYRPFDGTDADVAPTGVFELEFGAIATHDTQWSVAAPAMVLNYGIAPRFELVVQGNFDWPLGERAQLSEAEVLVKSVLRKGVLQDQSGPSVALESGIFVPEPSGQCCGGLSEALILSHRFGPLTLHWNGEVDLTRQETIAGIASVIVEGPQWRVRPVAEALVSVNDAPPVGNNIASLLGSGLLGAIATFGESFALDAAFRAGTAGGQLFTEFRLGFTWSLRLAPPPR